MKKKKKKKKKKKNSVKVKTNRSKARWNPCLLLNEKLREVIFISRTHG